jgi:esterase/lipase superfamily enzyme
MSTPVALVDALQSIWEELPALVGADWPALEKQLLVQLRALDATDADGQDIIKAILALIRPRDAAWKRLVEESAGQGGAVRQKSASAALPAGTERPAAQRYVVVPVMYATDRAATGRPAPAEFFGGGRSADGELAFGIASVSIPDDHRMGALEAPRMWRLQFRADPEKHVILLDITPLAREAYFAAARDRIASAQRKEALVFVHGYNVTFEDGARRAAQIAYDLHFQGIPMLYSWPSEASTARYTIDETNVYWSRPHFQAFLRSVLTETGAQAVHVIAHSMGNRVLTETIAQFNPAGLPAGSARLRQIVFAAPDVDAQTFADLAKAFHGCAERFTLYASSGDLALQLSKKVHGYARAGDSGEGLITIDEIDTIDASAIDTSLLGHSYFGDNRSVVGDLFRLINEALPPEKRYPLRGMERNGKRYWLFPA